MTTNEKRGILLLVLITIFILVFFCSIHSVPKSWLPMHAVQNTIGCLYLYNDRYKSLPDYLTEEDFPLSKTPNLIYSKNGIKDSKGNFWLVVLQTEVPSTYYAGRINKEDEIIEKITGDAVFEQQVLKAKSSTMQK